MTPKYQTIDEYISNYSFYHVTTVERKDTILRDGLSSGMGIYVVRSESVEVAKSIFEQYVIGQYEGDPLNLTALVVKIKPSLNRITREHIRNDHATNSPVLKTQNIIMKRGLVVLENDISILNWKISEINYSAITVELLNHPNELRFYNPNEQNWKYESRALWDNEWIKVP